MVECTKYLLLIWGETIEVEKKNIIQNYQGVAKKVNVTQNSIASYNGM